MCHYRRAGASQVVQLARFLYSARPHTVCVSRSAMRKYYACVLTVFTAASRFARCACWWSIGFHRFLCTTAGSYTSCSVGLLPLANNALHCTSMFMYSPNKCTNVCTMCHCILTTHTHTQSGFLFNCVVDVSSILTD